MEIIRISSTGVLLNARNHNISNSQNKNGYFQLKYKKPK